VVGDPSSVEQLAQRVGVGRPHNDAGGDEQVVEGALCHDPAGGDDDQPIDGRLHLAEQVAGQEHSAAAVGEVAQQGAHPGDAVGVESVGGFVEDERPRLADQRLADAEALSHTEGVRPDPAVRGLAGEPDLVEYPADLRRIDSGEVRRDLQGGSAGPSGVHGRGVEQGAHDPGRGAEVGVPPAADRGGTGVGSGEPGDHS